MELVSQDSEFNRSKNDNFSKEKYSSNSCIDNKMFKKEEEDTIDTEGIAKEMGEINDAIKRYFPKQ